ncbi:MULTISPECIES: hypothetical protein [unclassified Brevundimonas]|uniref:hypothetical protein n=1 Tax=unclassified Brevundimonas TaxID=2622653 RepID=UPI0025C09775|nr:MULTISPECIES: hypothetical protein [unclassified Brevundimonas]
MRIVGILLIVIGGLLMAGSFSTDITVAADGGRVANLAMAAGRQAGITVGGFVFLSGWVALGAAAIRAAILKPPVPKA